MYVRRSAYTCGDPGNDEERSISERREGEREEGEAAEVWVVTHV